MHVVPNVNSSTLSKHIIVIQATLKKKWQDELKDAHLVNFEKLLDDKGYFVGNKVSVIIRLMINMLMIVIMIYEL